MGEKGARHTDDAGASAADLIDRLEPIGEITSKKMFGGYGVFAAGAMFALVDSSGRCFFKADRSTQPGYEAAGSEKHGRMPYWSIPETVIASDAHLLEWGQGAAKVALDAKK